MTTLKRDIQIVLVSNGISLFLLFCASVILTRVLGPATFGLLGLALLIPEIAGRVCPLGFETVNATFAGLYKDRRTELFQQTLLIVLFGSLVSTLFTLVFFFWLPIQRGNFAQVESSAVWISCLITPSMILAQLLIALTRGIGRIAASARLYILQTLLLLVLTVLFLIALEGRLQAALWIRILSPLTTSVCSLWLLRDYLSLNFSRFSFSFFRKGLSFGSQICLSTVSQILNYRMDQVMLAYMVPADQLGRYVLAVAIAERLKTLPRSISTAFLPSFANDPQKHLPNVPRLFRYTLLISAALMAIIGALSVPAIWVFFGKDYVGTIAPLLWLLPGIAALSCSSITASVLAAQEKPKYSIWTGYISLGLNLVLNIMLIPRLGINGAAVSSSTSSIFAGMLWMFFFKKETAVPLRKC